MIVMETSPFEEFGDMFVVLEYQEIQILDENISLVVQSLDERVVVRIMVDVFFSDMFFMLLCPFRIRIIDAVDREISSMGI